MAVLKDLIVHGPSRLLNLLNFSTAKGGTFAAEKGVFNELIATDAQISNLQVDELEANNLTAQNATIVGLLDVQGEMHTNTWTNSNMATIEGNFYITPTVKSAQSTLSISSAGTNLWKLTISGTFANVVIPGAWTDSEGQSRTVIWPKDSKVLVTGNVVINNITYPLGTCQGILYKDLFTTGTEVTNIQSEALNAIVAEQGQFNAKPADITISLYQIRPDDTSSTVADEYKPIGILLTASGTGNGDISNYIDVYGGVNTISDGTVDNNRFGLTMPNVRIGNLNSLPPLAEGLTAQPDGWGIYTDHGYFKGEVAATSFLAYSTNNTASILIDSVGVNLYGQNPDGATIPVVFLGQKSFYLGRTGENEGDGGYNSGLDSGKPYLTWYINEEDVTDNGSLTGLFTDIYLKTGEDNTSYYNLKNFIETTNSSIANLSDDLNLLTTNTAQQITTLTNQLNDIDTHLEESLDSIDTQIQAVNNRFNTYKWEEFKWVLRGTHYTLQLV